MKASIIFLILLVFSNLFSDAQTIDPTIIRRDISYSSITRIINLGEVTRVSIRYTSPSNYKKLGGLCVSSNFFLRDDDSKKVYKFLKAYNIPVCPEKHNFEFKGQMIEFQLDFEQIPPSIRAVDIIEDENNTALNFYGVIIQGYTLKNTKSTPKSGIPITVSSNIASTNSTISATAATSSINDGNCDNVTPISGTTNKPDFRYFLTGVKKAVILTKPEINGHTPAFNALIDYLKALGFESVEYYSDDYVPGTNACEEVAVELTFDYDLRYFTNVKWTFGSPCFGYKWEFQSSEYVSGGPYDDAKGNFLKMLKERFEPQYRTFNSQNTLKYPYLQTCWTERNIKESFTTRAFDKIEGIYENTSSEISAKYRVAVRKINGTYYLIYLNGAKNNVWKEGDIKAVLESTATPMLYKAKWYMGNKAINNDYFVSFEQGLLNVISSQTEKELYIKLFPTSSGNVGISAGIKSSGTGFAISSNGYIVTNYHVIEDAARIQVRGINGDFSKAYTAKVITEDKNNDLAVIKIDDPSFKSLGTVPYMINSRASDVGTAIFVLGYPLRATMGDEIKLTNGIISSKSGFQGDITAYQVTAPIQPGNSGGPMFDNQGNVIGIINAKHKGAENASYAIKSSYLLNLIDLLPNSSSLHTVSLLKAKPLTEQVKIARKFTYIIEVN